MTFALISEELAMFKKLKLEKFRSWPCAAVTGRAQTGLRQALESMKVVAGNTNAPDDLVTGFRLRFRYKGFWSPLGDELFLFLIMVSRYWQKVRQLLPHSLGQCLGFYRGNSASRTSILQ